MSFEPGERYFRRLWVDWCISSYSPIYVLFRMNTPSKASTSENKGNPRAKKASELQSLNKALG